MVEFEYRADELVVYENEDEERDMLMIYESAEKGHILMLDERFELKPTTIRGSYFIKKKKGKKNEKNNL